MAIRNQVTLTNCLKTKKPRRRKEVKKLEGLNDDETGRFGALFR